MRISLAKSAVFLFALTAACATTGQQKAQATKHGLVDTKAGVDSINTQIDGIDKALQDIQKSDSAKGDSKVAYNEFVKKLDTLETTRSDTRSRAEGMESNGDAYFKKWEEEIGTVKNESIRKVSLERRDQLQAAYEKIKEQMKAAGREFTPYMNDLKDLKNFFATDLTPGGIKAMDPAVSKIVKQGKSIRESATRLSKDLQKVIDVLKVQEQPPPEPAK